VNPVIKLPPSTRPQAPSRLRPLFAVLLLSTLVSCGADESLPNGPPGKRLFIAELCASCHGYDLKGGWMGPPLLQLQSHWQRDELADFIRTPTKFTEEDERLGKLSKKFQTSMVGNQRLSKQDRLLIADWLLAPTAP
jgi:hypothetical protein